MRTVLGLVLIFGINAALVAQEGVEEAIAGESYWEQVKRAYESVASEGGELTEEAKEWFESDLSNIGDWEYSVDAIETEDLAELEASMNEKGAQRWECFWIDEHEGKLVLVYKRRKFSFLQKLSQEEVTETIIKGSGISEE